MIKLLFMALLAGLAATASTETQRVAKDRFGTVLLVQSDSASASEQTAAKEIQKYWRQVTGYTPAIMSKPSERAVNIWVGPVGVPEAFLDKATLTGLGGQGILLKTIDTANMLIVGGPDSGTLYAAYQFIEDALGVRFLAPDYTYIPPMPASIPCVNHRFVPPFEYRYTTNMNREPNVSYYLQAHRFNEGPGFTCHSVYHLLPPEKHFKDHPDFYSMIDGKRIAPTEFDWRDVHMTPSLLRQVGQLCMTNPATIEALTKAILDQIDKAPSNKWPHISQMDWENWCTCDTCAAIDAREESHIGATLFGINQIAENVEKARPGYGIETLAYTFTRKPPKYMKPRPNVAIKLCSIECDFSRPLSDPNSELNRKFAGDIEKWSKLAPRLHVWDYTTNFRNFQTPFPNFHVLQPNVQFFLNHNVRGIFEQGSIDRGGEFAPLRGYLLAKLMWNPEADVKALMDEFLHLYYGEAAPYIREYIQLITDTQKAKGGVLIFADRGSWIDKEMVAKAEIIFANAFTAVDASPRARELRPRVEVVYLQVQYSALMCPPDVTITEKDLSLTRPPSLSLEEYAATLKKHGVKHPLDGQNFDGLYKQIGTVTPPRAFSSTVQTIANDQYEVWVAPEAQGTVLRWRDKKRGIEWVRGYETYGLKPGLWQDWALGGDLAEKPAADKYAVVNHTSDSITLRATLANGVVLDRVMTLSGDALDVALTCTNPTTSPQTAGVKMHPEFWTQGANKPEVWAFDGATWSFLNKDVNPEHKAWGRLIDDGSIKQAAFYLPKQKIGIEAHFESAAGFLGFFSISKDAEHVNLEVLSSVTPLAPGETRTTKATFSVAEKRPTGK